jgi:hypothetical protein
MGIGVVWPSIGVDAIECARISSCLCEGYDPTMHDKIWLMCPLMTQRGIPVTIDKA